MRATAVAAVAVCLAVAGCSPARTPGAPIAIANTPPAPVALRLRAADHGELLLHTAGARPDGGVIAVVSAVGAIRVGDVTACAAGRPVTMIASVDARGALRWTRCLTGLDGETVAAVSDRHVWIAHKVGHPGAPEHVHDGAFDLVEVLRVDGEAGPIDRRIVAVWKDLAGTRGASSASSAVVVSSGNLHLTSAAVAGDDLLLGGVSQTAALVDGVWTVHTSSISLHGFVLAIPAAGGPVRALFDSPGTMITSVAAGGARFAAAGWCSTSSSPTAPEGCDRGGTVVFVVDGALAVAAPPRLRTLAGDLYTPSIAIDREGAFTVAALSWTTPIVVDGQAAPATCAPTGFAASWTADGQLRFVRALGDCAQDRPSPFAVGGASSRADDRISDHHVAAGGATILDGAHALVVHVGAETNGLDWPLHLDGAELSVPFAGDAVLATLDGAGAITRQLRLQFSGRPERDDQPDGSLASDAGVSQVVATRGGGQTWVAVAHGGSLVVDGRAYPVASRLPTDDEVDEVHFETGRRVQRECDVARLRAAPRPADHVDAMAYGMEPDEYPCRRRVVVERAIELIAVP